MQIQRDVELQSLLKYGVGAGCKFKETEANDMKG
jgi:hypothetical protein